MGKVLKYGKRIEGGGISFAEYRLTNDQAAQIMAVLTGPRRPVQIQFEGNLLRTAAIEIFDEDERMQEARKEGGLNLDDPGQRAEVEKFEEKLLYHKSWAAQGQALEWYGYPLTTRGEGWVINPLLGAVHWSTVLYAVKGNAIRRNPNGVWIILAETLEKRTGGKVETKAYDEIRRLIEGLNALEMRRRHARLNETGPVSSMTGGEV